MSNRAHTGRCSRAWRKTKARKLRQGVEWQRPIRWKVPEALRAFLSVTPGSPNQRMAGFDVFARAMVAYNKHRVLAGTPPLVVNGGDVIENTPVAAS